MAELTLEQAREQLTHEYKKSEMIRFMYPSTSKNVSSLEPVHFATINTGVINECSYLLKSTHGVYISSRIFDFFMSRKTTASRLSICIIINQGPMELFSNSSIEVLVNHLYPEPIIFEVKHLLNKTVYRFRDKYNYFPELEIIFIRNTALTYFDILRGHYFDIIFHTCPEGIADELLNFIDSRTQTLVLIKTPRPKSVIGKEFYAGY